MVEGMSGLIVSTADSSPFLADLARDQLEKMAPVVVPMHHSMDFHAGTVAPNDKWRMIQPGESIRFDWVANYPGVYLYHCGAAPVLMHMAMGQYGVVVVSPRNGFPTDAEVDRSYVVVQSEFYLKPGDGNLHVLDYDAAMAKQPSQVVFNGHTQALIHSPLVANAVLGTTSNGVYAPVEMETARYASRRGFRRRGPCRNCPVMAPATVDGASPGPSCSIHAARRAGAIDEIRREPQSASRSLARRATTRVRLGAPRQDDNHLPPPTRVARNRRRTWHRGGDYGLLLAGRRRAWLLRRR